jgi:hypothetical protein
MNNDFLSDITRSYLNDKNISKEKYNELYEYILETRKILRAVNPILYNELLEESKLYQQRIIYRLFDSHENICEQELLNEDLGIVTGGIALAAMIGGIFIGLYEDNILSQTFRLFLSSMSSLKQKFLSVEWIKRLGDKVKQHEVILSMLDEEYSNCAKKCNIDVNQKLPFWKSISNRSNYNTFDVRDKSDCAITCTLDFLTSSYAELSKVYKVCLQKTGEDLSNVDSTDDPLSAIPTGSGCQEIRDELDNAYKNFKKMIDILFKENPQLKSLWINIMNQKVKDALSGKVYKHYSPRNIKTDLRGQYINSGFK